MTTTNETRRSDFYRWREAMGFDGKGSVKAGALIGLTKGRAIDLHSGRARPTETELLAMSAARAGLPPWTPELDHAIALVGRLINGVAGAQDIFELNRLAETARARAEAGE